MVKNKGNYSKQLLNYLYSGVYKLLNADFYHRKITTMFLFL